MKNLSVSMNNIRTRIRRRSPELLFAAGVVSMIGCVVTACRSTIKAVEIKERHCEVDEVIDNTDIDEEYTEAEQRSDRRNNLIQCGWEMIRIYALPIALGGIALGCFGKSHSILTKRNAALTAAFASLNSLFTKYRKGVIDKYGKDEDFKLMHGVNECTITEMNENGKDVTTKHEIADGKVSIYTKYIKPSDYLYKEKNGDYEMICGYLEIQQNYLNDLLRSRYIAPSKLCPKGRMGFVSSNEMYDACGFDKDMNTTEGMVTGVTYDPHRTDGADNRIIITPRQVEIYDEDGDIVNAIAVDFNIEGTIYDK